MGGTMLHKSPMNFSAQLQHCHVLTPRQDQQPMELPSWLFQAAASLSPQNHRHLQTGLQGTQVAVALLSALRLA